MIHFERGPMLKKGEQVSRWQRGGGALESHYCKPPASNSMQLFAIGQTAHEQPIDSPISNNLLIKILVES